ncbi:hypothetical protein GBA65_06360 [Rubrobacter marinus]|uniref:Membrane-bound metal-dependent hydrolase n=1 Tax=Rubrobacter marinus TaxID=2653852 RepID=A0A6G8PVG9_9ACTN|nr:hypothetical protein [Rubrobacter marinus]QIN78196.1 hypothetical protein GBA65_06360 [Rubrobacter marinus]
MLPDVPAGLAAVYYGTVYLLGRDVPAGDSMLDAVFFKGPFGATGSALHSVVPPAAALLVYALARSGRVGTDPRRILLWFLVGWIGHTIADFVTHVDDTRPLFWPLSGWEWSSPVSYYNPRYYGREFFLLEHGGMLAISLYLLYRRVRGQRKRGPG